MTSFAEFSSAAGSSRTDNDGTVVDCHVHLLPGRLGESVRRFFDDHLDGPLVYPNDHAVTLHALASAGISEVWNLPYAHRPHVAEGLNRASAQLAAAPPHRSIQIIGGATIHPADDSPERILAEALDTLGLRVLKLHCSVGDFDVNDPRLDKLWKLAEHRSVPTVIHAGHHISGETYQGELAALENVARRFPGVPLIIAHTAHPATAEAIKLIAAYPNVYADLTPRVIDPVAVTDEDLEAHADRFLLGTDAPNTGLTAETCLSRLDRLSPGTRAAVLGGNAQRLLANVR